jgi:hypothetical protein
MDNVFAPEAEQHTSVARVCLPLLLDGLELDSGKRTVDRSFGSIVLSLWTIIWEVLRSLLKASLSAKRFRASVQLIHNDLRLARTDLLPRRWLHGSLCY